MFLKTKLVAYNLNFIDIFKFVIIIFFKKEKNMPVPKRRHSKSRGRKRRTHWKLKVSQWVECSHCHQLKLPHTVCPHCGFYKGKEIIVVNKKTE